MIKNYAIVAVWTIRLPSIVMWIFDDIVVSNYQRNFIVTIVVYSPNSIIPYLIPFLNSHILALVILRKIATILRTKIVHLHI